MKEVRFLGSARHDLDEIVEYYNLSGGRAGSKFTNQVKTLIHRIQQFPESYISISNRVRRALLRDFPYALYYAVYPDSILIVSIGHQHRHPDYWKDRIKDIPK